MLGSLILMGAVSLGAAPTAAPKDPLQPLQFLVGHCWAGDLPREMGRDTHCFEAMYGSHFIRDKHVVHGKNPDYLGETLARHGGSISAEHGIGLVKKPYLSSTRSAAEVALMRSVRAAFDPQGIMNPGKLFD